MACQNSAAPLGLWYGNTTGAQGVVSRGVGIGVGSPIQVLSLRPSVADDALWLYNADDCVNGEELQCIGTYGGVFNSSQSRTYKTTTKLAWNGTALPSDDLPDNWIYFNDNIHFGTNGSSYGFPIVMSEDGKSFGSGVGLGPNSNFLSEAVKSGAAPYSAFGIWVGSQSIVDPVDGALWVGGYDTNRVTGDLKDFPMPVNCPTCVVIQDLEYQYAGKSVSLFSNTTETLTVQLQPGKNWLEVPSDIYANFMRTTQAQGTFQADNGVSLTLNPNAQMGNLSVTLNNGYKTVIPAQELFYPPRDINNNGQLYITNTSYEISAFWNKTYEGYIFDWGIPFLTMNYMTVDWVAKKFQLAPARQGAYTGSNGALIQPLCQGQAPQTQPNPGPTTTPTTSPSPTPVPSKHSNVGAIAGGVVGGVAGLLIIAAMIWFILRSKKREKTLKEERDAARAGGSEAGAQHERMSQFTATSPTEVSEVYAGGKAHEHNPINQWLHGQNEPQQLPDTQYQPYSHPPRSPIPQSPNLHSTSTGPTATNMSPNMNQPFEMPAY